MTIFLAICFIPILPFLYFTIRNEAKPKNNLILSTTLPKEAWTDERVLALIKAFKRYLLLTSLLLLAVIVPVFFIGSMAITLTYFMVWLIFTIIIPYLPYCHYVKKLRQLKKENWYHPEISKVKVVDTKALSVPMHLKPSFAFVLPFLISLIPMLYPLINPSDISYFSLYLICSINSCTILVLYFCYRFLLRKQSDSINEDTTLTMTLTRVRRFYWGKFWLTMAWFSAIYSFSTLFLQNSGLSFIIFSSVFIVALLIMSIRLEFKVRTIQQHYNATENTVLTMDEDDYWIFGVIYYNPNDTSLIINNRVGLGSTMNMAKPFAKGITIFAFLLLFAMPFLGVGMMKEELTPVTLQVTENSVDAYHTHLEYEIELKEIKDCYLMTELPSSSRNWGTGMKHLYKGYFSVKGISNHCYLCLNPEAAQFIVITTIDKTYIFSVSDEDNEHALDEIFQTIQAKLSTIN